MALFNRRKKTDLNLPPEVQAYSQAEHRQRMGMAWLVGIVSLVITVFVLTGLFFGGRWLYREIANGNSDGKETASQSQSESEKEKEQEQQAAAKKAEEEKKAAEAKAAEEEAKKTATSSESTNTPAQAPTQPKTGDDSENLVRTGPDIDL